MFTSTAAQCTMLYSCIACVTTQGRVYDVSHWQSLVRRDIILSTQLLDDENTVLGPIRVTQMGSVLFCEIEGSGVVSQCLYIARKRSGSS
jgi:hypothetical protein